MTRICLVIALLLLPGSAPALQDQKQETEALCLYLGFPAATPVKLASSRALQCGDPVKLFLGFGLDMSVRDRFTGWIDEWNRKDGKKYGRIEVVAAIDDLEVVVARMVYRDQLSTRTESRVKTGAAWDWQKKEWVVRPMPTMSTYEVVPIYGYILNQTNGHLFLVSRYTVQGSVDDDKNAGRKLWDELRDLLKARDKK